MVKNQPSLNSNTMKKISYESALKELKEITDQIQEGTIGLEHLEDKIKRATELLEYCQSKLRSAEVALKKMTEKK